MSGRSKRLWLSGAASLIILLSDQALSQTATPAPAQSPAPAHTPAPTENTPTPPAGNAPASPTANAPNVLPQTNVQAPKVAAKPAKQRPQVARQAAPPAPATPAPAPLSPEQVNDPGWREHSACWFFLEKARERAEGADAEVQAD